MSDIKTRTDDVMPSAAPSEDEIQRWQALPRDVQLERMREMFNSPECNRISKYTAEQVLARARRRSQAMLEKNG